MSAGNAQAASLTKTESEGGTHAFKVRYSFSLSSFLSVGAGRERGLQMDQGEGRGRRGSVIVPGPPNPSGRNPP